MMDELIEWCEQEAIEEGREANSRDAAELGCQNQVARMDTFREIAQALRELQQCREENERLLEELAVCYEANDSEPEPCDPDTGLRLEDTF